MCSTVKSALSLNINFNVKLHGTFNTAFLSQYSVSLSILYYGGGGGE